MTNRSVRKDYYVTIGIECHVQLKTKTKLFAAVGNDARKAEPNTLISHICLGMPGALPVLNEKAVELAMRVAFAFNTRPQAFSYFERKHYFYPDLPKGYQITQLSNPIIVGGTVEIEVDGRPHIVHINRVQIEEDAGKNTHPTGGEYSLVDLNRAGTPLLEIVSEPDIHSPAEAKAYVKELYLLMKYADVSDVDLFHGNMRFDVNVSVSKDHKLGVRTETKNLNSFKAVEKAAEFEIERQIELLEKGQKISQETRGWDDAKQKTFSQRGKEEAHDYRYMPEPDIPPIELDEAAIETVRAAMPELPDSLRQRFSQLGLSKAQVATIVDEPEAALLLRYVLEAHDAKTAKTIGNWLTGILQQQVTAGSITWQQIGAVTTQVVKLVSMVDDGALSSTAAKDVLLDVVTSGDDPQTIATIKNLLQVSDEAEIEKIVKDVLADNPKAVEDVKNGEVKAIGFLVGKVMAASRGKANPQLVQSLLQKHLR